MVIFFWNYMETFLITIINYSYRFYFSCFWYRDSSPPLVFLWIGSLPDWSYYTLSKAAKFSNSPVYILCSSKYKHLIPSNIFLLISILSVKQRPNSHLFLVSTLHFWDIVQIDSFIYWSLPKYFMSLLFLCRTWQYYILTRGLIRSPWSDRQGYFCSSGSLW